MVWCRPDSTTRTFFNCLVDPDFTELSNVLFSKCDFYMKKSQTLTFEVICAASALHKAMKSLFSV